MAKKPETSLTPKDIGVITSDVQREHAAAVRLLARQNALVDGWLEANTTVDQLANRADPEIIRALEDRLLSINDQLRSTFAAVRTEASSPEEEVAFKQAEHDLQTLAVLQAEKEHPTATGGADQTNQTLFFSSDDLERAAQSRTAEEESGDWWQANVGRKMSIKGLVGKYRAHTGFKTKLKEQEQLRGHHQARTEYRKTAAKKVTEVLNTEQFTALERQLKKIQTIVRIFETGTDTLRQPGATDLQKIKAEQCLSLVHEYAKEPTPDQSFGPVSKAYAELQRVLDIKQLTMAAAKRVERMVLGLEEQIAIARAKKQGIIHLFETLPKAGRLDRAELDQIYGQVQVASQQVETAYTDVSATTQRVLAKLHVGSTNPAQVEGLVMTIENGNLNELYLGTFTAAMKEFNVALGKLLNLRAAPELAMMPEPRGLLEGRIEGAETNPDRAYQEMRELFGEKFLGCEAVEQAFTLQNNQKLLEFNPSQKAEAARLLAEFVNEPDVKQFMDKVKRGEIKPGGWQLRLQVGTLTDQKSHLEVPLTMAALEQRLAPDMKARKQGKLLYEASWYKTEQFYTADTMPLQWVLSTDEVVPATLGKNHEAQTKELEKFAKNNGLQFDPVQSRSQPLEALYRSFVMLRTHGRRTLENTYDWSATKSSDGHLVFVGDCDARGAFVGRSHPERVRDYIGSSFSRRSGQHRWSLDT